MNVFLSYKFSHYFLTPFVIVFVPTSLTRTGGHVGRVTLDNFLRVKWIRFSEIQKTLLIYPHYVVLHTANSLVRIPCYGWHIVVSPPGFEKTLRVVLRLSKLKPSRRLSLGQCFHKINRIWETWNVSEFDRKYFCFSGSNLCLCNDVSTGGQTQYNTIKFYLNTITS
jgi:hypothetical protein